MVTPNKKQQECIDNIEGQYLVLAGPGTGKTFTVVRRIENIINHGTEPSKILCLTFTDTAANEMKKGIDKQLGEIDSDVNVYTYHSFCNEIIKDNPREFELPENFRLITNAVSRAFIKECIDEINPVAYRTERNDPYYYINDILNGIVTIKQNRLTKEEYFYNLEHNPNWILKLNDLEAERKEIIANGKNPTAKLLGNIAKINKNIAKIRELWQFLELYTEKMNTNKYIDFNDMISMVLDKFDKDVSFLSDIANKYEYILVDEYQDTNKSQNDIVFSLTKGLNKKNVFVVGDDDQIIYTFQGARLDTIERFLTEFPDTKVVCLEENMRSTQSILDVAREIAKQDDSRLELNPKFAQYNISKKLIAKNEEITCKNKSVRFCKYQDLEQEYNNIVDEIEMLIKSEECPLDKENKEKDLSQIAVLTKSNAELEDFAELLKERNIPYELKDGKNIFNIKSVIIMFYYMQFLINPELHSDKIFKILLNKPFNINPKDFETLCKIRTKHKALIDCMRELKADDCCNYSLIEKFIKTYDYLKEYITAETLKNIILEIGIKTEIFDYYLNEEINRCDNIAGLKKLIEEAKELSEIKQTTGIEDFVEYLTTCINEKIEIKTDKAPVKMNAVQLSTYHSAKGKEYEYVYMPTLFNTKWESKKGHKDEIPLSISEAKSDDEYKELKYADCIRVLYVGMTRAKHTLRLSYYAPTNTKTKLTCFITKIQDLLEKRDFEQENNENIYWAKMAKTLIKRDYDYEKEFRSLIDSKISDKPFSASSINTYLKCPRQYLYKYILGIDSKGGNMDAANFGSAVHYACEFLVNKALENGFYPAENEFIEAFKQEFNLYGFSTYEQREILLKRGTTALERFYHHLTDISISTLYKSEYNIRVNLGDSEFTGFIDRLDKNADGTYSIFDYKTGGAKGLDKIGIGKEHEDYYNQIGLYKYFFEQSTGCKVKETTFIFPEEPEENLTLNLTDEECIEIKNKFLNAIQDIKNYKFEPCENRDKQKLPCKYCSFKEFCNLEVM